MLKSNSNHARKSIFHPGLVLIMLSAGLALTGSALAADSVGTLKFSRGDVSILAISGEARSAAQGAALMIDERIVTGAGAIAVIRLADDSRAQPGAFLSGAGSL